MSNNLAPVDRALTKRQKQIVDHILLTGESPITTAETLETDASFIYKTLKKPNVRKYLHDRTLAHIGVLAPYASKAQEQLLNSDSDQVRLATSEAILNRHFGKAVERRQVAVQGAIEVTIDLS